MQLMKTMATLMKSKQFVIFLIVLTLLVASSEARIFPEFSAMKKKVDAKLGLRELINNVRNGEWHQRRSMLGGRAIKTNEMKKVQKLQNPTDSTIFHIMTVL
ncbi:hypothetical protein CR513_41985, partial [Mucuna pruriens]